MRTAIAIRLAVGLLVCVPALFVFPKSAEALDRHAAEVDLLKPEPRRRPRQLIFEPEDLREILDEWERRWHLDMPNLTPFRTHGGVI